MLCYGSVILRVSHSLEMLVRLFLAQSPLEWNWMSNVSCAAVYVSNKDCLCWLRTPSRPWWFCRVDVNNEMIPSDKQLGHKRTREKEWEKKMERGSWQASTSKQHIILYLLNGAYKHTYNFNQLVTIRYTRVTRLLLIHLVTPWCIIAYGKLPPVQIAVLNRLARNRWQQLVWWEASI